MSSLGADADEVWHVGDNLLTDIAGARNAGLTAVWLNRVGAHRQPDDAEPDIEIVSFSSLDDLLSA